MPRLCPAGAFLDANTSSTCDIIVSCLGGVAHTIRAEKSWTIHDVKVAVERQTKVDRRAQQLFHSSRKVSDSEIISSLSVEYCNGMQSGLAAALELMMIRLSPEVVKRLEGERKQWTTQVQQPELRFVNGFDTFRNAPEHIRGDRDVVLPAVQACGESLEFAADWVKADKKVVLAAVTSLGGALRFAAPALQGDREVVLAAVSQNGTSLEFASAELQMDREVVLAAVLNRGESLEHASEKLRGDRDIVSAAVSEYGPAYQFASQELQDVHYSSHPD